MNAFEARLRRRKLTSAAALSLATMAALYGLFWLVFIVGDVTIEGIRAIDWNLFTADPTPPGIEGGGLRHAFVGHALLVGCAILIGLPLGFLGGVFLAEYGRGSRLAKAVTFVADLMVSVPSIVIGTFVYAIVVRPTGHFSGWAGSIALAIMMVPIVVRTTQDMLELVPNQLREAAFALGAPYYRVIFDVVVRRAAAGILTGFILAIARIAAETAPLLFTSFNNNYLTTDMSEPIASLTVTMFVYAMGPYDDWHRQAWGAAFVITLFVLAAMILGRLAVHWRYGRR